MTVIHGDCMGVVAGKDPESVDAILTDPPYGLEFMGKEWDKIGRDGPASFENLGVHKGQPPDPRPFYKSHWAKDTKWKDKPRFSTLTRESMLAAQEWHGRWAEAAYRVAKPSAYLLAFGGTRTVHRMTVALEDAGWIIRDMLVWGYASGFPKSKASLKPAWEPIVMARKPGPLRDLAIDACRMPVSDSDAESRAATWAAWDKSLKQSTVGAEGQGSWTPEDNRRGRGMGEMPPGRWPANIVLTDPIFDGGIEGVVGGGETTTGALRPYTERHESATSYSMRRDKTYIKDQDSGTYSRFFLIPKADRADREPVLGGLPVRDTHGDNSTWGQMGINAPEMRADRGRVASVTRRQNVHPTVKPTDLMRHLVRLVTPTGGTVLDPFLGSGTTGLAAEMEGFEWVGIERELEYVRIAEARLNGTQRGLGLPDAS